MQGEVAAESGLTDLDEMARRVLGRKGAVRLTGLRGAAGAVVAAHLLKDAANRPALFLVANAKAGDAFASDLRAALGRC